MKRILILLVLIIKISFCQGQYSKDKLISILTNDNIKSWSVKGVNTTIPEKSYSFNKDFTVAIGKVNGTIQTEKWVLNTADNIRWFIAVGNQKYEIIVSYDKNGKQFIKLTHHAGDNKASVYYETILYPLK